MCRSTGVSVMRRDSGSCMTRPHRCSTRRYGAAVVFIERGFQPILPLVNDEVGRRDDLLNFPPADRPGADAIAKTDLPRRQTALERCWGSMKRPPCRGHLLTRDHDFWLQCTQPYGPLIRGFSGLAFCSAIGDGPSLRGDFARRFLSRGLRSGLSPSRSAAAFASCARRFLSRFFFYSASGRFGNSRSCSLRAA